MVSNVLLAIDIKCDKNYAHSNKIHKFNMFFHINGFKNQKGI